MIRLMKTGLSVVVPAYNEEKNIAECINSVSSVLKKLDLDYEIIVVNDGSKDKTGEIAKSFLKKIPGLVVVENKPNRGYGGSLRKGYDTATKEFITIAHADNQFNFSEVTKLLAKQRETNADIVSGIRVGGGVDPFVRRLNRWGWNSIVRALFGYLATDVDSGFKLFKREILSHIKLTSERGAMIDTQFLAGARARGYSVVEMPVTHLPRTAGASTGGNLRVIIQSFLDLFKFWWQLRSEIMVEQGRAVFKWEMLGILVILVVAAFSRLWHISGYMTFLGDEGRDVQVVRDMLLGRKFTLLGPGTSIGNMYLGPLYYYLMLVPLWLTNFSPVGPAIQVAVLGVATVWLLWWMARQLFGRTPALAISLLYALSPTVITYSHSSWNPNIMPFFALLAMYGIWKVWRLGYWRWLLVTAVSLGFVLNSHYLGLLLFPTIGFFWVMSKKTSASAKYTVGSLALFLLLISPMFLFDLRHDWMNSKAIAKFFLERQETVNLKPYKALPNLWPVWESINTDLLGAGSPTSGRIVAFAVFDITLLFLIKRTKDSKVKDLLFVLLWGMVGVLGLALYKQHIYAHYFGFIFPVPFLLLGFSLDILDRSNLLKLVGFLWLIWLLVVNLINNPLLYPPNNQMSHTREVSEFIAKHSDGKPFNLALISKSNYDASYRYFLDVLNTPSKTIHQKLTDQLFVICESAICEPIGHPLWEIAAFGWAKIDNTWDFPWGVRLFKLVPNPSGK